MPPKKQNVTDESKNNKNHHERKRSRSTHLTPRYPPLGAMRISPFIQCSAKPGLVRAVRIQIIKIPLKKARYNLATTLSPKAHHNPSILYAEKRVTTSPYR
jgi:hypothetical protein